MSTKISFKIAMPTDGENVEKLNADKFEKEIAEYLNDAFGNDVLVSVNVFSHDGTGSDRISISGADQSTEYDLRDHAEQLMPEAVSNAFSNPDNYDD
jgi:hypothetical protein